MARRLLASAVIALIGMVGLVGMAPPASAHSVSGVGATNWETILTSVTPAMPGMTLRVVEDGSRIELINHGPEILVYGYQGEPYLRVGPKGVFINTLSPAAYLNCSRKGCPVPSFANPSAPPKWEQISTGQTVLWHDHRTHWMGRQLPPLVARNPDVRHIEAYWTITMAQGATTIRASGYYTWVPGPSGFPWFVVILGLAGVGVVIVLTRSWVWLAVATGVVAAVDFGHAVAVAWFWAGGWVFKVAELFEGSSYQIPGWILGFIAVRLLRQGNPRGRQAAACAGGSALVFTGFLDFDVLYRSHGPFDGSIVIDRVCVSICVGLGVSVLVGALALIRADRPRGAHPLGDLGGGPGLGGLADAAHAGGSGEPLDDHGHALAPADTHGLQAQVAVVEGQGVDERRRNPGAGHPEGMPDGNGATVDIELVEVDPEVVC